MKQILLCRTILTVLAVCTISSGSVHAHGTGFQVLPESAAVAVHFFYTGGGPMAYAQIHIQGPVADQPEHQNGRTDCKGIFAFCPNQPGTWNLTVNDGRGHSVHANIEVAGDLKASGRNDLRANGVEPPGWIEVSVGLSILLNIALMLKVLKKRK